MNMFMKHTKAFALVAVACAAMMVATLVPADANPPGQYWAPPAVDTPTECVDWADGDRDKFYIAADGYISHVNGFEWLWKSYGRCIMRGALRNPGDVTIYEDGSVYFEQTGDSMCLPLGACNG